MVMLTHCIDFVRAFIKRVSLDLTYVADIFYEFYSVCSNEVFGKIRCRNASFLTNYINSGENNLPAGPTKLRRLPEFKHVFTVYQGYHLISIMSMGL